jgi:hypothetical protein
MTIFNYLKPGIDPNSPQANGGVVDVKNGVYYYAGGKRSLSYNERGMIVQRINV